MTGNWSNFCNNEMHINPLGLNENVQNEAY